MYRVARAIHFSYGHRLVEHGGKCKHIHGHNGRVEIEVSSSKLNKQGMVVDFADILETIGQWIDKTLDHRLILWEKDPLVTVLKKKGEPIVCTPQHPTAEFLAKWIFDEARKMRLPVFQVTLWETDHCYAIYHE